MRRALVVAALLASACAPGADGDRPVVVSTVWPLAWLAEQVVPGAEVRSVPRGAAADPHDAELTPSEVLAIRTAAVILYVGDIGYQPAVEEAVADARGTALAAVGPDDTDPHFWHRPTALIPLISRLISALADRTIADLDRIVSLPDELGDLSSATDDLLRSCPLDEVVVSHAGYAPLLDPLGIEQHAISGVGGHTEPTAARIEELADLVAERNLPAVLTEPAVGREAAAAIARRANVDLIEVAPLAVVSDQQAERGYFALYRENVLAFARALGCDT